MKAYEEGFGYDYEDYEDDDQFDSFTQDPVWEDDEY